MKIKQNKGHNTPNGVRTIFLNGTEEYQLNNLFGKATTSGWNKTSN
jgi:hypothetical protein